jgi:hypothetical protein
LIFARQSIREMQRMECAEILHVTFGSVLTAPAAVGGLRFHDRLREFLRAHAELYAVNLEAHFLRHLKPFAFAGDA